MSGCYRVEILNVNLEVIFGTIFDSFNRYLPPCREACFLDIVAVPIEVTCMLAVLSFIRIDPIYNESNLSIRLYLEIDGVNIILE